jgi:hypothetical protein
MALSDPLSITYNGASVSLSRISTSGRSSEYASADGSLVLVVSHQMVRGREQALVKLTHSKVTADPLIPSQNRPYSMTVHSVINRPLNTGYSDAEAQLVLDALSALLAAATFKGKILGGES